MNNQFSAIRAASLSLLTTLALPLSSIAQNIVREGGIYIGGQRVGNNRIGDLPKLPPVPGIIPTNINRGNTPVTRNPIAEGIAQGLLLSQPKSTLEIKPEITNIKLENGLSVTRAELTLPPKKGLFSFCFKGLEVAKGQKLEFRISPFNDFDRPVSQTIVVNNAEERFYYDPALFPSTNGKIYCFLVSLPDDISFKNSKGNTTKYLEVQSMGFKCKFSVGFD